MNKVPKIGIIGGGQLGKMMIQEAKKMNIHTIILDPTKNCPCHFLAEEHIVADFNDAAAICELAKRCDVITYEFEHIDADTLRALEREGKKVYPTADSLVLIQNKLVQKQVLQDNGLPVPEFRAVASPEEMQKAGEIFGYPFLLKTCQGGYDGKGNYVVTASDSEGFSVLGNGTVLLMAEKYVAFVKEVSVLACRGVDGEIVVYPVAENLHHHNILHKTIAPAAISKAASENAMGLAREVMQIFDGVGMFCVEMFVTVDERILINEIAPRPHNSGHYTIEACVTSQFENHIRAVAELPLGDTTQIRPAVMRNLLGEPGFSGIAKVEGMERALRVNGAALHVYGKEKTSPSRKMGHITVVADSVKEAECLCDKAASLVTIRS